MPTLAAAAGDTDRVSDVETWARAARSCCGPRPATLLLGMPTSGLRTVRVALHVSAGAGLRRQKPSAVCGCATDLGLGGLSDGSVTTVTRSVRPRFILMPTWIRPGRQIVALTRNGLPEGGNRIVDRDGSRRPPAIAVAAQFVSSRGPNSVLCGRPWIRASASQDLVLDTPSLALDHMRPCMSPRRFECARLWGATTLRGSASDLGKRNSPLVFNAPTAFFSFALKLGAGTGILPFARAAATSAHSSVRRTLVYGQKLEFAPMPSDDFPYKALRVGGRSENITKSALNEWMRVGLRIAGELPFIRPVFGETGATEGTSSTIMRMAASGRRLTRDPPPLRQPPILTISPSGRPTPPNRVPRAGAFSSNDIYVHQPPTEAVSIGCTTQHADYPNFFLCRLTGAISSPFSNEGDLYVRGETRPSGVDGA